MLASALPYYFATPTSSLFLGAISKTLHNLSLIILLTCLGSAKRGVESKLVIGNEPIEIDETLLRNIGHAHRYFDMVCSGKTFGEIADAEGVSKRRIQQLIELAFLAPDMIRNVRSGKQPVGLTSDWLMRHAFSPVWSEQREQFTAL